MQPVISVHNLKQYYETYVKEAGLRGSIRSFFNRQTLEIKAVDGISFTINEGEIVGFLGSNGAGKTTTLKMLSGVLHPTGGDVHVLGHEPKKREVAFLKSIGMVMGQKQQLAWDLSPMDSFLILKTIYDISDTRYEEQLADLVDLLDLSDCIHKPVRKLSLGQRMKCELAAALIHRPSVLFLDEPTIALDVNVQLKVRDFIRTYNEKYNATIILTSHYIADVEQLAERVILIGQGKIKYDGPFKTLLAQQSDYKVLKVETSESIDKEMLTGEGTLLFQDGNILRLQVPRDSVAGTVSHILANYNILDISIEEPPIEETFATILQA